MQPLAYQLIGIAVVVVSSLVFSEPRIGLKRSVSFAGFSFISATGAERSAACCCACQSEKQTLTPDTSQSCPGKSEFFLMTDFELFENIETEDRSLNALNMFRTRCRELATRTAIECGGTKAHTVRCDIVESN